MSRCDLSIAIHKGTRPVFGFNQPLTSTIYLPHTYPSFPIAPCLDYKYDRGDNHFQTVITDKKLAELWETLSSFCGLVNSAVYNDIKLSDRVLSHTMGSVMYTLLRLSFPTNSINESIRLGLLAFCSHCFLERQGIHLPNVHLYESYRNCFEDVSTQPGGAPQISLWLLMIGKISLFASNTDESSWIKSRLGEIIGLHRDLSWQKLRLILKSFLWIDILHDAPGKMIFESVSYLDGNAFPQLPYGHPFIEIQM